MHSNGRISLKENHENLDCDDDDDDVSTRTPRFVEQFLKFVALYGPMLNLKFLNIILNIKIYNLIVTKHYKPILFDFFL